MRKALVAQPYHNYIERKSEQSAKMAGGDKFHVMMLPSKSSLLAHNFNDCVVHCLKDGGYDCFAMLHSDLWCADGWLAKMWAIMEDYGWDVIHAPACIKNNDGFVSTAVAYSDDEWGPVRRITLKELKELPQSFDIDTLRCCYDANATRLLPNTGCLVMRCGEWMKDFSGFEIKDRIVRVGESEWCSDTVPEDWNFGHWCARNGVSVGATKAVVTNHIGPVDFRSDSEHGVEIDWAWVEAVAPAEFQKYKEQFA